MNDKAMIFKANEYLASFTNWEPRLDQAGVSSFSLASVDKLLLALGRPDDKLKFIHVAGSKGKGSTSVFAAEILRAAGYRTGLYTSPHLYSVRERIRILEPGAAGGSFDEGSITEQDLTDRLRYYQGDIDALRAGGNDITWFEVMTAIAVSHFASKACDVVVLETGLGGRLDATNLFETSVAAITPIGLEHTAILGKTLTAIAGEKAGIIKGPMQRVVVSPQAPEAMTVLKERCALFGISPTVIGGNFPFKVIAVGPEGTRFQVEGRRDYGELAIRLAGAHQAQNAAAAVAMVEDLEIYGFKIDADAVRAGLARAQWPCRFEVFPGGKDTATVVIDAAHTAESAAACADTFEAVYPDRKAVVVFGTGTDKDARGMARALARVAQQVVVTRSDHPRALDIDIATAKSFLGPVPVTRAAGTSEALEIARRLAGPGGVVLVAGSIFLAAEARQYL